MPMISRPDKSLKKRNQPQLIIFLSINVILLAVFMLGSQTLSALLNSVLKGDLSILTKVVALPAVAGLVLGIVSWMVPKPWKETLIFWRSGARRLPSSEAFTKIAPVDLRIDMTELSARLGA